MVLFLINDKWNLFFFFKGEGEREREGMIKEIYEICIIERNDNLIIMGL